MFEQGSHKILLGIGVLWMLLVCWAMPSVVFADRDEDEDADLVGTWRVTVPGNFFLLFVFNEDNTMTVRSSAAAQSMGSGVWEEIDDDTFAATYEAFLDTDPDPDFDLRARVHPTIQLWDDDMFTSTQRIDVLSLDGNTFLFTFTTTSEGTRMTVIPE